MNSINFKGLPPTLQRRALEGLTASELKIITLDAARAAGIAPPKVSPKLIREYNADIFTPGCVVSGDGAEKLTQALNCKNNCVSLRDAIKNFMKKNTDPDIDYNIMI